MYYLQIYIIDLKGTLNASQDKGLMIWWGMLYTDRIDGDRQPIYGLSHVMNRGGGCTHSNIFIIHQPHRLLFTLNSEIIIIDLTYKTNRFKISIFNFVGSTATNLNFLAKNVLYLVKPLSISSLPFNRSKRNAILLFTHI